MLARNPNADVRVYVVWEEITFSDWTPPSNDSIARMTDLRARQYYDANTLVAKAWKDVLARDSVAAQGDATYVKNPPAWDCALYFPAGAQWAAEPPAPTIAVGPIVSAEDALAAALTVAPSPQP